MRVLPNLLVFPWESMTENNCNTYVISGDKNILIDPGHYHLLPQLERKMRRDGLFFDDIDLVLATHPHPDHIEGAAAWNDKDCLIAAHLDAVEFMERYKEFWEDTTRRTLPVINFDFLLKEGKLKVGEHTLRVIGTPGHCPGSVCFFWEEGKVLFSGDVIFFQSFGRFDLPGGDPLELFQSIEKLVQIDAEVLAPGHGPAIQGRGSVKQNFYIVLELFQQMVAEEVKRNGGSVKL